MFNIYQMCEMPRASSCFCTLISRYFYFAVALTEVFLSYANVLTGRGPSRSLQSCPAVGEESEEGFEVFRCSRKVLSGDPEAHCENEYEWPLSVQHRQLSCRMEPSEKRGDWGFTGTPLD